MLKKPPIILGVNPGARYIGIAVLSGPELRDWGVKVINGKWSTGKMGKALSVVSGLIKQHEPAVLAVKDLHPSRSSPNLIRMVSRIQEIARRKGILVCRYSIEDMKTFFFPEDCRNKRELADKIASEYPALLNDLGKEKSSKNPYHVRMFEAVALALICFHNIDKH
jgi:hypothetical protein